MILEILVIAAISAEMFGAVVQLTLAFPMWWFQLFTTLKLQSVRDIVSVKGTFISVVYLVCFYCTGNSYNTVSTTRL